MGARTIILLSCSYRKRPGGAVFDTQVRSLPTFLERNGRTLREKRLRIAAMLRGESGRVRLYNGDQRGGFRDEQACNQELRFGADLGGHGEARYLPAHQRYMGRFFSGLSQEAEVERKSRQFKVTAQPQATWSVFSQSGSISRPSPGVAERRIIPSFTCMPPMTGSILCIVKASRSAYNTLRCEQTT